MKEKEWKKKDDCVTVSAVHLYERQIHVLLLLCSIHIGIWAHQQRFTWPYHFSIERVHQQAHVWFSTWISTPFNFFIELFDVIRLFRMHSSARARKLATLSLNFTINCTLVLPMHNRKWAFGVPFSPSVSWLFDRHKP